MEKQKNEKERERGGREREEIQSLSKPLERDMRLLLQEGGCGLGVGLMGVVWCVRV